MGSVEQTDKAVTEEECRNAMVRVLSSDLFTGTDRLSNFLSYIVEETLAGRGGLIRGKTIAMDVYRRDPATGGQSENVVRVDARRLRRRLLEYYATDGKNDPVRIRVDKGGYVPRMEFRKSPPSTTPVAVPRNYLIGVAVFMLVSGLGLAVYFAIPRPPVTTGADPQIVQERRALRESSPATLQAVNLAEQARAFLFPLLEPERQRIATDMFRQAILVDPEYFGGYAGAAQTLATLSKLTPPGPVRDETLAEAVHMLEIATAKNPAHSWTQSAAGWVAFTSGDFDHAFKLSSRSVDLSPQDGYILDFHGMISALSGHFEEARKTSDPSRPRKFVKRRLANRNIYGVANFHLGKYEQAIASFHKAADLGDPISALSLMYQAAAYQSLGNTERAFEIVQEMTAAWPEFRPDLALPGFYQHQEHVDQIIEPLRAAGWRPKN